MSFIHKFIHDLETPEPVKILYRHFIREFEEQNSNAWTKHIVEQNDVYHRKTILKQGRCDFDKPRFDLTSEELIILYNYYYFPMHFQSSFEIFCNLFEEVKDFQKQIFFFHDFGCGTLSSTMAFGASFKKFNFNSLTDRDYNTIDVLNNFHFYFQENAYNGALSLELGSIRNAGGITNFRLPNLINGYWLNDISNKIHNYLKNTLQENFHTEPEQSYFFNVASCTDSHFHFENVADKFYLGNFDYEPIQPFTSFCNSQKINRQSVTVVINFSYVLASDTIDIEQIKVLISEYQKTGCKMMIINQNPDLDSLNIKWEQLKSLSFFSSIKCDTKNIKHFGSSKVRYEVIKLNHDELSKNCLEKAKQNYYSKDYHESLAQLNTAININPNYENLYSWRAACYNELKQYEPALADCNKYLSCNPKEKGYGHLRKSLILRELHRYDDAVYELKLARQTGFIDKDLENHSLAHIYEKRET